MKSNVLASNSQGYLDRSYTIVGFTRGWRSIVNHTLPFQMPPPTPHVEDPAMIRHRGLAGKVAGIERHKFRLIGGRFGI